MTVPTPTFGALFAGYGGLEMGVQSVTGGTTLWHSEIEPGPCKILAHHWPNVPNLGDITKVDWATVPPVDVITGGSPCQDISTAGARKGLRPGTRSGLWASMCDAVDIIRPSLVVWENVAGALSADANSNVEPCPLCVGNHPGVFLRALGRVLGDLTELGYDTWWQVVRASDAGAAHLRGRVFVFAWPANTDSDQLRVQPVSVGGGGRQAVVGNVGAFLPTPRASDMFGAGRHGDGGLDLKTAVKLLPTPRASDGTNGGPNQRGSKGGLMLPSAVQADTWGDYAHAITRHQQAFGCPAPPTHPARTPRRSTTLPPVRRMAYGPPHRTRHQRSGAHPPRPNESPRQRGRPPTGRPGHPPLPNPQAGKPSMTHTEADLAKLAARDVELAEQIDQLQQARATVRSLIRSMVPGPDTYQAGPLTVVVQTNRRFNDAKALAAIPPDLVDTVTVPTTTIDRDRLKVLMPDVYDAAWVHGDWRVTIT